MRTRSTNISTLPLLAFTILMSHSLSTNSVQAADPDLMGWWSMDTEVDGMVLDSSGNGRHGTLNGAPAFVAGVNDGAIELFGGPDFISIEGYQGIDGTNPFSIAAWVKTTNTDIQQIMHWGTDSGGQRVEFRINSSRLRISHGNGNVQGNTTIPDGEWHHVVATVVENASASSGDVTFYVNGVDDTQEKSDPDTWNIVASLPITIGYRPTRQDRPFFGLIDDVALYSRVLTAEEIPSIMEGLSRTVASSPQPSDEADDVVRSVVLEWSPGDDAATHNIYLSSVFEDVNSADAADTLGVLASQAQEETTYAPQNVLEFGQTYYWRVDEVNAAPDNTVFRGDVWSFAVEPLSRPITNIAATASSSFGISVAENTINGSGLMDDLHGVAAPDMWISAGIPATIEYAFDRVYKLHELWIWNSNQAIEAFVGFGAKDVVIEHSLDGETWTVLEGVSQLAQAPGIEGYAANNMIDFGGAVARHVRVTINSVFGIAPQASLSEVRFLYIPTFPTGPNPVSGATDVAADVTLSWDRDGREAARHDIYLGANADAISLAGSVTESSFDTLASDLQLGEAYYWQVVEVNDAMDPMEWAGDVWSFTTVGSIVVDDMESYRDKEFLEIWATWVDGFENPGNNGAIVGAVPSLGDFSPETTIVNGGSQSLPIHFDNSAAPLSEATRTFDAVMDWSKHGVQSLVLFFEGSPANTGGQLYVKINETKISYDGAPSDLMQSGWNQWTIPLSSVSESTLSRVTSLTIGIEGSGSGVVYVDEIELTTDPFEQP